jgi:hypothetical protein
MLCPSAFRSPARQARKGLETETIRIGHPYPTESIQVEQTKKCLCWVREYLDIGQLGCGIRPVRRDRTRIGVQPLPSISIWFLGDLRGFFARRRKMVASTAGRSSWALFVTRFVIRA